MAGTTWQVIRQDPDQYDPDNTANPATGVVVHFQTGAGNTGSVFVPYARYSVHNVRQMVAARALLADEIGALTGHA